MIDMEIALDGIAAVDARISGVMAPQGRDDTHVDFLHSVAIAFDVDRRVLSQWVQAMTDAINDDNGTTAMVVALAICETGRVETRSVKK